MTEYEKMLAGEYYDPSDLKLKKMRIRTRTITEKLNNTSQKETRKRRKLIKKLFGSTGENIYIESTFK